MSIQNQANQIPQAVISNGLVTGNQVQNPNNLLNTTNSTAIFGATSDVIIGNFPFNIPLDAVIVGIKGVVKARIDNSSVPAGSLTPVLVDASSGSNEYFPGADVTGLSNVLQEYEIGGEYDAWGNAWTPVTINNLRLQLVANSSLEVAWATLTVFYYIPIVTPVPSPFELPGCEDCDSEIQALPFELKRVWRTNETVLLLKSFNLPNGTPITMDMLGECGGTINLTIDPDLRKEDGGNFIENFNLLDSIASITITPQGVELDIGSISQRGLGFDRPYGHNIYNISEHAVGAVVIITNNGPYNSKLLKRCHVGTVVGAPQEWQDEGDIVAVAVDKVNVRGDSAQASQDPSDPNKVNLDIVSNPSNVEPTTEDENEGTNNTTPSLTLTVPLTVVSANYLRVAVITEDETITGVTYNGVPMTPIAEQANPGSNLKVALFGLINPAVGAHNAVVTMPNPRIITAIVTSWLDVDTTNPVDGISSGNIGSDDQPTDSVTTTTENTVMQDVVGTTNNPTTFTQYGLWAIDGDVTTGDRPGASSSRRVLVPQTLTDIYSISVPTDWAIVMAGIRGITSAVAGDEKVKVTSNDTTPGYLADKIEMTSSNSTVGITPSTQSPGGNEKRRFDLVVQKNNLTANTAPTGSNDNTQGYQAGSLWFNTATSTLYVAISVGTGTAVWDDIASGSGGSLDIYINGVLLESGVSKIDFTGDVSGTNPVPGEVAVAIAAAMGSGGGTKIEVLDDVITASAGENYTVTIPGGTLSTNNAIRFKMLIGAMNLNMGDDVTVTVTYGGQPAGTQSIPFKGAGSGFSGGASFLDGVIIATGADTTQYAYFNWGAKVNTLDDVSLRTSGIAIAGVDSALDQDLVITLSRTNNGNISASGLVVEKVTDGSEGVIINLEANEDLAPGDTVGYASFIDDAAEKAAWAMRHHSSDLGVYNSKSSFAVTKLVDDTYVFLIATIEPPSNPTGVRAIIGQYDRGTSEWTFGDPSVFLTTLLVSSYDVVRVSDTKFAVAIIEDSVNYEVRVYACDVSGTTITLENDDLVTSSDNADVVDLTPLDTGTFAMALSSGDAGGVLDIYEVTGTLTGTPVIGSVNQVTASNCHALIEQIGTNKIAILYATDVATSFVRVASVSAGVWTNGTAQATATLANRTVTVMGIVSMDTDQFYVSYYNASTDAVTYQYLTVSGTTITPVASGTYTDATLGFMALLSDQNGVYLYTQGTTSGITKLTVSGAAISRSPVMPFSLANDVGTDQVVTQNLFLRGSDYYGIAGVQINSYTTGFTLQFNFHIQGMTPYFIGVVQNTVAKGGTAQVKIAGVDTNQTGLTAGAIYDPFEGGLVNVATPGVFTLQAQSPTDVKVN